MNYLFLVNPGPVKQFAFNLIEICKQNLQKVKFNWFVCFGLNRF